VNLNRKLATAFATGAVLASGIVYFAVQPSINVEPSRPESIAQTTVPPPPAAPTPAPPAPRVAAVPPAPVHEKRSPMPPPVRRERPVAIAPYEAPVTPPSPTRPVPVVAPEPPPPAPVPIPAPIPVAPSVPVENVSLPAPNVQTRVPNTVTLADGTVLAVRIGETLSSARNQAGDTFLATLTQPLVIDGFVIAERGARLEGKVVDVSQAGRVSGVAYLRISLARLATADGQNIRIRTEPFVKQASRSTGTDAAKIGGGAALGAIIGAIAGGGKGAAIGAGAGGAVGAGDVLLTRGQAAEIKVETRVSFRVQDSITITERLD
jgi:hypothetical protein